MSDGLPNESDRAQRERMLRILLPAAVLALGVVAWDLVVRVNAIPPFVLPGPGLVFTTLIADWAILGSSLVVTLTTTVEGFVLAAIGGIGLAVLFNRSRVIDPACPAIVELRLEISLAGRQRAW